MASGRRKKFIEVESNCNLFEFFTRNESESDPAKIVCSILSVMVSESVAKVEKALSGQWHHSLADNKMITCWKLNHPWLILLQTNGGISLKCSVCSEAKVSSIWAQEDSCNVQKKTVTSHSQSSEHSKRSCIQQKICSESSSDCKTEEQQSSSDMSHLC